MWTLGRPTASLSAAIRALAWMAILLNLVKSSVHVRTVDLPDVHAYHLRCHVLYSAGAMVVKQCMS